MNIANKQIVTELIKLMPNTWSVDEKAMALAQLHHESAGFTRTQENLNYSAERLVQVFPKYFTIDLAKQYEHKPEQIANRIYGNRMGNGDETTGDGYKYRGRGFIQITGKSNYTQLANDKGMSVTNYIAWVELNQFLSALHWLKYNKVNLNDPIEVVTRRINGGLLGLSERTELFNQYKTYLRTV